MQRHVSGTEAIYLLVKRAFDELGYRRYEWKCDNLNERSRAAALRYGFRFEGVFRNAAVVKGRNRNTAWFSITDDEWPAVKTTFEGRCRHRARLAGSTTPCKVADSQVDGARARVGKGRSTYFTKQLETEWEGGCRNGSELLRRLKTAGFVGSLRVVTEWTTRRRRDANAASAATGPQKTPSGAQHCAPDDDRAQPSL